MGSAGRKGKGHALTWGSRGTASPRTGLVSLRASPGSYGTGLVIRFYSLYCPIPAPVAVRVTLCLVLSFWAECLWWPKPPASPLQKGKGTGEGYSLHNSAPAVSPGPDI